VSAAAVTQLRQLLRVTLPGQEVYIVDLPRLGDAP